MATYTEKLGLKLPSQTDFYNVDDFNENFRKLDQNTAQSGDIQQVLTLADPIRSNRAPTTADAQFAGKLWVVPKMIFNNMMPDALAQVASNWKCTASTSSASGSSATIVGDGTASTIVSEVDMTAVRANDIVYINAKMAVTADANGAIIELLCGDDVIATTSMSIPTAGDSTQLIDYIKVDEAGALKLRVTTMYNSASAQLGKGVTISDITILDLTADMCQNFAGIEFTKDETTAYIDTYGNFQTKTYELSEYWWICRGSYGGQYSWQRYDDYTNAKVQEYSDSYQNSKTTTAEAQAGTNDTHWMTPLKTQQFLTAKIATQTEAQTGSDNTKVMTPLRVANQITAKVATTAEAQAGSVDTKIMTPLKTQQFLTAKAATDAEATAGTVTTKWISPKQLTPARQTVLDTRTNTLRKLSLIPENFTYKRLYYGLTLSSTTTYYPLSFARYGKYIFSCGSYRDTSTNSTDYSAQVRRHNPTTLAHQAVYGYASTNSDDYSGCKFVPTIRYASHNGSIIPMSNGSTYYIFDMEKLIYSASMSRSDFAGCFTTTNYRGYLRVSSKTSTTLYYASRSGNGTAWSNSSIAVTLYSDSSSYIAPVGAVGDVLYFVYLTNTTTLSLGKVDMSTRAVTLGITSVTLKSSASLSYFIQLQSGKVLIQVYNGSKYGHVVLTLSSATFGTPKYYAAEGGHLSYYLGSDSTYAYFWSNSTSTYEIYAINRSTGDLAQTLTADVSLYTAPTSGSVKYESVFNTDILFMGHTMFDISRVRLCPVVGPLESGVPSIDTRYYAQYPVYTQGITVSDYNLVGVYGYGKNNNNYTHYLDMLCGPIQYSIGDAPKA